MTAIPYYKTMYLAHVWKQVYFFTTDDLQDLGEDEEEFVNVATIHDVETVRRQMAGQGYKEITNPNPAFVPPNLTSSSLQRSNMNKQLASVIALSLQEVPNLELATVNLIVHWQHRIPKENLGFAAVFALGLIDEENES